MPRYLAIADQLKQRVETGGYHLKPLPRDIDLASELNASRMTVRKALDHLIESGVLIRYGRGKIRVRSKTLGGGRLEIAYLGPSFSGEMDRFRIALEHLATQHDARIVPVGFVHWEDPVIDEVLATFDGAFLFPPAEKLPEAVAAKLAGSATPLIAFFDDVSHLGIRSVDLSPAVAVQKLLSHLHDLGHRRIDCLNTQPIDDFIDARIQQWMVWRGAMGAEGELLNEPVQSYTDPMPAAYELAARRLRDGTWRATAVICATSAVAMATCRALLDHGKVVGRDVSVCSMVAMGNEHYLNPTLTTLTGIDPTPYLAAGFRWMAQGGGGRNWAGPLHIRAADVPIYHGQSTGPAPAA
jgi:DNA-binding Lrp family transcriptional regulator